MNCCPACSRPVDTSTRLTGDVVLCPCGEQLLVRHGDGRTTTAVLNRQFQIHVGAPPAAAAGDTEGGVSPLRARASGLFLTAQELYTLAYRTFDFGYELSESGACYQVRHGNTCIAEVATSAQARAVIVERFKELLKDAAH